MSASEDYEEEGWPNKAKPPRYGGCAEAMVSNTCTRCGGMGALAGLE